MRAPIRFLYARFLFVLLCLPLLTACDAYPRDAAGTTERIRADGFLRVGVIENRPWAYRGAHGGITGTEARLVTQFAQHLDALPRWFVLPEEEAFEKLHARELDLLIGGLTIDNPRRQKAGLSRPYLTLDYPEKSEYVMAVIPGENRFLITLENFLRQQTPVPTPEEYP